LQVPTVALFGPSGDIEWGPWQNKSIVISSDQHPCRPCGQDGCGNSKVSDCLTSLQVEQIVRATEALNPA
jgi:heptosyltransferase-3